MNFHKGGSPQRGSTELYNTRADDRQPNNTDINHLKSSDQFQNKMLRSSLLLKYQNSTEPTIISG